MRNIETILFWITLFTYIILFCFQLFSFVNRKEKYNKIITILSYISFSLHISVWIIHWIASGHPPVTDTYELNLTGTLTTMGIYLLFTAFGKLEKVYGLVVIPILFIVLGYGYMSGIELNPMGPAFQSPWLVVHVLFAWLAFGCYAIATGASIFLLLKSYNPEQVHLKKLPDPEDLDITGYRFIVLGFINHAIMLVSGAIWAKKLWGHYWNWDPLETWSLIAFLYYAFYLHARSFLKWKGKRSAWMAVLGILILAVSFWGVELFGPSVHPGP